MKTKSIKLLTSVFVFLLMYTGRVYASENEAFLENEQDTAIIMDTEDEDDINAENEENGDLFLDEENVIDSGEDIENETESSDIDIMSNENDTDLNTFSIEDIEVVSQDELYGELEQQLISNDAATNLDVTVYGADGSDTKDDSSAIQKALDYAKNTDETIYVTIPAGSYYIEHTLIIYSNTHLCLDENALIIRTDETKAMLKNGLEEGSGEDYSRSSNIVISGGTWDGNVTLNDDGYGESSVNLFYIIHASGITITDISMKNCCGNHFIELAGVQNSVINNCSFENYIYYNGYDYSELWNNEEYENGVQPGEAIQLDYTSEETSEEAAPFDNTPCKDITINGCSFVDCLDGIGSHHADIQSFNYIITNNKFTNIANYCVRLPYVNTATISGNTASNVRQFCLVEENSSDVTISKNTVSHQSCNGSAYKNSIYVSCSSVSVENNTINNPGDVGIRVVNSSSGKISNNIVKYAGIDGISVDSCVDLLVSNNEIIGGNSCIDICSCGSESVAININGNTLSGSTENTIYISDTNAIVSGNTIKNAGTAGIRAISCFGKIDNNEISKCKTYGVSIEACGEISISDNIISETEQYHGIQILNTSDSCTVSGNKVTGGNTCISVADSGSVSAIISITGNSVNGSAANTIYISNSYIDISGNTVSNSGTAGIRAVSGSTGKISGNVISECGSDGISIDSCNGLSITENEVDGGNSCINISASGTSTSQVKVSGNTLTKSTQNAIYAANSLISVKENSISNTGTAGVRLINSCSGEVSKNTISVCGTYGINIDGCKGLSISDNSISKINLYHGIQINNVTGNCDISGNTVTGGNTCISINDSGSASTAVALVDNTVSGSTANTIYISNSYAKIASNKIASAGAAGVRIVAGSNATVDGNTITKSGTHGISVSLSTVVISNNTIQESASSGINVNGATVNITGNIISSSGNYGILVSNDTSNGYTSTGTVSGNTVYNQSISAVGTVTTKNNTLSSNTQTVTAKIVDASINVGETTTITASGKGTISYKSSNTSVATVNSNGVVTGVGTGSTTITITAAGNAIYNSASTSVKVTVKLASGSITSLTNTSNGILVKWKKVSGATGYIIYRKTTSAKSFSKIKTINAGTTVSYTDTSVKNKNGTTYQYKVVPVSGSTTGSGTSTSTVRLKAVALSSVKNLSSKAMTVKWKKTTKVTGYQIQYSTSKTFSSANKTKKVSGASKSSVKLSSLKKGKTYYVRIRTYKVVNGKTYYSAWSTQKSVKISK